MRLFSGSFSSRKWLQTKSEFGTLKKSRERVKNSSKKVDVKDRFFLNNENFKNFVGHRIRIELFQIMKPVLKP